MTRRDVSVQIRVTEGERERWKALAGAAGLSLSEWIRERLAGGGEDPAPWDEPKKQTPPRKPSRSEAPPKISADRGGLDDRRKGYNEDPEETVRKLFGG